MEDLAKELRAVFKGEISTDDKVRKEHSRDASIFEVMPQMVVFPKDSEDIQHLISFVAEKKKDFSDLSLAVRSGGTCMSGGTLTNSISVDMQHLNHILEIGKDYGIVEPGTYYRDFEKATLDHNLIFPSYTSSKLICTAGGMVANNAGGEKSLEFGKTEKYVEELQMVLRDGKEYTFKKLSGDELDEKMRLQTLEGDIYRNMFGLFNKNYDLIQKKRPTVTKNSSGYTIWNVWDKQNNTFDLSQIFIGAQGTLGINTKIKFRLVPTKKEHGMLIIYMKDFENLPEIVHTVLRYNPAEFESFDDYTMDLALKYVFGFAPILKTNTLNVLLEFLPDYLYVKTHGMPRLFLIVEFEDDARESIEKNLGNLQKELAKFTRIRTKIAKSEAERNKYWAIRRESFNLLKQKMVDKKACPFIDDTCVNPDVLPEFLPKLYKILNDAGSPFSIQAHIGNGNFHIFPLLRLDEESERQKVFDLSQKVFDLVFQYGGSMSGEHNDGFVRSPYLKQQFGEEIYDIFKQIKLLFDPDNIFNPHKKIDVTKEYIAQYMMHHI